MKDTNKGDTCGLDFMAFYGHSLDLKCEKEMFHEGPHEQDGFVWGYIDQDRDPFTQKRKTAALEAEARRTAKKSAWFRKLRNRA